VLSTYFPYANPSSRACTANFFPCIYELLTIQSRALEFNNLRSLLPDFDSHSNCNILRQKLSFCLHDNIWWSSSKMQSNIQSINQSIRLSFEMSLNIFWNHFLNWSANFNQTAQLISNLKIQLLKFSRPILLHSFTRAASHGVLSSCPAATIRKPKCWVW
jgi:hypothetical protein